MKYIATALNKNYAIVRGKNSGRNAENKLSATSAITTGETFRGYMTHRNEDIWYVQLKRRPSIYSQQRPSPHVSSPWNRILSSEGGLREVRASVGADFYNTRDTSIRSKRTQHATATAAAASAFCHEEIHTGETVAFPFLNRTIIVQKKKHVNLHW